ncbi:ankyrin [Plakobranchus ocellatus]|uniref:Ankyrin n=1 Tax=Plakobranchus ocellatus TaxID=259542 RepID=A0AAV3YCE2_9GAST|nr:ankyrin [Plakobranchus ocellatus]
MSGEQIVNVVFLYADTGAKINTDPDEFIEALLEEDLREIDRLLGLMESFNNHLNQFLTENCRADLKSLVAKRIDSKTNLDPETCQTLLRPAIVSGCTESIEALLNRGADLNLPYSYCNSVLVVAITLLKTPDLMKMVKFLLEKGANINRNFGDYSPLLVASLKQPDIVPYLLQKGANVNEVGDLDGNTPLTTAVHFNECRYSTVGTLLSTGADPNKANNDGETALHLVRDAEITNLLIQAGANLEARDDDGQTPLLAAAYTGEADVINVLLKSGADMKATDNDGNSALHMMVMGPRSSKRKPQEETMRLFAFQCNEINKKGMTPLMSAAQGRQTKAVKILLNLGAENIITYKSGRSQTAVTLLLDNFIVNNYFKSSILACMKLLITHNSVTSLPRRCYYFFSMIDCDLRHFVELMVTHGMAPLCESSQTLSQFDWLPSERISGISGNISPLAFALVSNSLEIAQYLTENWFFTPADLVGSMELRLLRRKLERESQADGLRFMDENLSQPMSLFKLCFVAVSAQLGGVAGREERVNQTPLPNILKDMLLFRRENFPMEEITYSELPNGRNYKF